MVSQVLQDNQAQLENQVHQVFPVHLETRATWEHKDRKVAKVHKAPAVNPDDRDNLENLD